MVRAYEQRRRRHERGLFLRPTMSNAILYTNNYTITYFTSAFVGRM